MKAFAVICVTLALCAGSVMGGRRPLRSAPVAPPPSPPGTVINEEGASTAVGVGGAVAEHSSQLTVAGDGWVPGLAVFYTGSDVGLSNSVSNYQQSQINPDGSSAAYQGNSAGNSGYASDYLGGDAQGITVDVQSTGWSAVEGEGAVAQVDLLEHNANPQAPPPPPPPAGWGWPSPARKP